MQTVYASAVQSTKKQLSKTDEVNIYEKMWLKEKDQKVHSIITIEINNKEIKKRTFVYDYNKGDTYWDSHIRIYSFVLEMIKIENIDSANDFNIYTLQHEGYKIRYFSEYVSKKELNTSWNYELKKYLKETNNNI